MQLLTSGGFNAVRLDFNHHSVLEGATVQHFEPTVEPGLVGKRYTQALHYIVEEAARHGLLAACSRAVSVSDALYASLKTHWMRRIESCTSE